MIEARAQSAALADRPFLFEADRRWTYREYRDACVRTAHFLRRRIGPISDARPGHVAMLLDNHLELLSLYGACGYAGYTLFGVNTGLRGGTLAGVLNQSRARVLVVEERLYPEVEKARAGFEQLPPENVLVLKTGQGESGDAPDYLRAIESEVGGADRSLEAPGVEVKPEQPLVVIYTSGTTGLPKGILNNHFKLFAVGLGISRSLQLDENSVGYACMPLFHSNSLFIGFSPSFYVGGALAMRDRFSASGYVPDVLRYGVTYWNYVGEPVHYILSALEKQYGGDEERILAEVARNPHNRLRFAIGNGA